MRKDDYSSYYSKLSWPAEWKDDHSDSAERFVPVELSPYLNNISFADKVTSANGNLNIWRNSYPIEQAAKIPKDINVGGVRFVFPQIDGRSPDNIRCSGQRIELEINLYDWIYILCAGERRVEDEAILYFSDNSVDFVPFCVSDFWPGAKPRNGELEAIRFNSLNFPRHCEKYIEPAIWRQRIPVARETPILALGLPNNIAAHIFSITCLRSEEY